MANLLFLPKAQFLDNNGDPLAGGKVTTSATGTDTPLATYTDQNEGTANDNPIILDPAGRADIWLSYGSIYRIKVQDADDNLISQTDDITGSVAAFGTLLTLNNNLDMNGFSIVTNDNKNLILNPDGAGVTKITRPVLKSDLNLNGYDIELAAADQIVDQTTSVAVFHPEHTTDAVNELTATNAATSNPIELSATGTDTNIDIKLLTKGTGVLSVAGTTNYHLSVTDDDDIPSLGYIRYALLATDAETIANTSTTKILTPVGLKASPHTALFNISFDIISGDVTWTGTGDIDSITDLSVSSFRLNNVNDMVATDGPESWSGGIVVLGSTEGFATMPVNPTHLQLIRATDINGADKSITITVIDFENLTAEENQARINLCGFGAAAS